MDHRLTRVLAPALFAATSMPAIAADANFQNYFFQACQSATGALATRCGETPGGLGDLSGDSESSLNPSQNMSHTKSSSGLADVRSTEARGRAEVIRGGEHPVAEAANSIRLGPVNLLLNGRATWFDRDRDPDADRERSLEGDSWAVEVGVDGRISERLFLGALATFESLQYDFVAERAGSNFVPAASAGRAETDSKSVSLYAVFNATEHTYLDAALGYGRQKHDFRRNPVFQAAPRQGQVSAQVAGDSRSRVYWAYVNGGYDFASGPNTFGPYAGLTYARAKIDAYAEQDLNGSGLAMSFAECLRRSALGHFGLHADRAISTTKGVFVPQLRVEYQREFKREVLRQASHFLLDPGAASVTVTGDRPKAGRVSIGAGITAILANGWIAFVNFDTLAGGDLDRQRVALGLRIEL